mmetsp:Transcript_116770/g.308492  ORF Transcript_116770/g.308492 Transcript_116770/m.308492 type:complete len:205 (+) Transcript_116770:466-1080(+)
MARVESVMARWRTSGLTQKIIAIPQPGRRYSHRHLFSTLCLRSDSSRLPVCSLRSSRFRDDSDVFSSRADFFPCTEGFSCSFSVPARSTSVSAPMVLCVTPSGSWCPAGLRGNPPAGFCTKRCTTAWDLDELGLQEETPSVRFARASWRRSRQVSTRVTRTIWYRHRCVLTKSSSLTTSSLCRSPCSISLCGLTRSVSASPRTS